MTRKHDELVVYATESELVHAAVHLHSQAMQAWHSKAVAWAKEVDPNYERRTVTTDGTWLGLEYNDAWKTPKGWRLVRPERGCPYITPHKKSLVGLEALRRMRTDLKHPGDLRAALPGMPSMAIVNHRWLTPGLEFYGQTICVIWATDPQLGAHEPWERIKLSEYYALKEAEDELCRLAAEATAKTLQPIVAGILTKSVDEPDIV